jgi:hypothetical protein
VGGFDRERRQPLQLGSNDTGLFPDLDQQLEPGLARLRIGL